MARNFNDAAGTIQTISASEMAKELESLADNLRQTTNKLKSELSQMRRARSQIQEELTHTAKTFLSNSVSSLISEAFDRLAEISGRIKQIKVDFATRATEFIERRLKAQQKASQYAGREITPETFSDLLKQAYSSSDQKREESDRAIRALGRAKNQLSSWEETSLEDDIARLDNEIMEKGGVRITPDNRSHYEPVGWFQTVTKWCFGEEQYRQVRRLLNEWGHGEDGKDAFADIIRFHDKYDELNKAISEADEQFEHSRIEAVKAQKDHDFLSGLADDINTDEQILGHIHEDAISHLQNTAEFREEMAKEHEEDFPRALPLLAAKIHTLDKLEHGIESRLAKIENTKKQVESQKLELARLDKKCKIKTNFKALQKQNAAIKTSNKHYVSSASSSWRNTRDYNHDTAAYAAVDIAGSFFDHMLIMNLLSDTPVSGPEMFQAGSDSVFTADLLGLDSQSIQDIGLSDNVLSPDEVLSQEMAEIGIENFEPGSLDLSDSLADAGSFDFEAIGEIASSAGEALGDVASGIGDVLGSIGDIF
jgi:uncharacterized UPF0160 family protein